MSLPSNYKQIAVGAANAPTNTGAGNSRSRSSGAGGGSDRNKDTTPIFTHSNYGNPAFTPQKAGKSASTKTQSDSRAPKPPKQPEKPVLPYMRYSKRIWDSVKAQHPDLKLWELGKKIGALWKQLVESEKQEFIDEYEVDKVEYEKALKAYHNSPAYLTYLAAKSKVKTDADVHETPSRAGGKSQQERRIDIQPAEDEDDQDDGYSFKHLSYARYLRNHRLINEIFSDAVVPDVRSVVTTQRMQVLKRQVSSLTMHQTKLEAELQQMEEKFEAKKQRMMESSEAFQEELKRHCKPAVDDETFQKMVQRMFDEMKRDRQRMEDPAQIIAAHAAIVAAVNRGEEKTQTQGTGSVVPPHSTHVIAASNLTATAAAVAPPIPVKKESPLANANVKPAFETASKTDPEPMDIEPTPKPSVPLPPKTEARPSEPSVKQPKPPTEPGKEPAKIPNFAASKPAPSQPGKAPTPTPTPPPTPVTVEQQPLPPTAASVAPNPLSSSQSTPASIPIPPQAQQQQVPPSIPMHPHHAPPTHPHLPPHMPSHQAMSGMPPHSYGNYGAPTGPTRSPYYAPQFGPHTTQPYGQYGPYSHYQQPYGPPPGSHYMSARPPPQHNGSPLQYVPEHGSAVGGQAPQPPAGHMPPHDVYGQPPHNPIPPTAGAPPAGATVADVSKSEVEKKDSE